MNILFLLGRLRDVDDYCSVVAQQDRVHADYEVVGATTKWDREWDRRIRSVDYVLLGVDPVNLLPEFTVSLQQSTKNNGKHVIALTDQRLEWENEISEHLRKQFLAYFRYGEDVNRRRLVRALLCMKDDCMLPDPVRIPWQGVWVPGEDSVPLAEYCRDHWFEMQKNTVLFLFHREQWLQGQTQIVEALCNETKQQGAHPIALFCQFGAIDSEDYEGVSTFPIQPSINKKECRLGFIHFIG